MKRYKCIHHTKKFYIVRSVMFPFESDRMYGVKSSKIQFKNDQHFNKKEPDTI